MRVIEVDQTGSGLTPLCTDRYFYCSVLSDSTWKNKPNVYLRDFMLLVRLTEHTGSKLVGSTPQPQVLIVGVLPRSQSRPLTVDHLKIIFFVEPALLLSVVAMFVHVTIGHRSAASARSVIIQEDCCESLRMTVVMQRFLRFIKDRSPSDIAEPSDLASILQVEFLHEHC